MLQLRDHLFETSNSPGMDLIALNIQRGRDHGLPSYNEYRDLCRLGKARDFSDLAPVIHPRKISQLERIYGNVDDIGITFYFKDFKNLFHLFINSR